MFTGLISDVGMLTASEKTASGRRMRIACIYAPDTIAIGASIACSGACMTAIEVQPGQGGGSSFAFDVSPESLARTTLGNWTVGTRVNLERSLTLGDELGGHLVMGHVDGIARIVSRDDEGETSRFVFEAPPELSHFVAEKGSVALDGTSLTVNSVEANRFSVTLIPHSLAVTTWCNRTAGHDVNLEVDLMARYAARLMHHTQTKPAQ